MRIESGEFKGRVLPTVRRARPVPARLKRSLFMVLAPRLEGARVLDLFAGVGGLGLEALSRGAAHVTFVDDDPGAVGALGQWLERVGAADRGTTLRRDLLRRALPAGPFDLIFADPPFALWDEPAAVALIERSVEALAPEGRLVLKLPPSVRLAGGETWHVERDKAFGQVAWALVARGRPHPPEA